MARLLGLCGVPPRPIPRKGSGSTTTTVINRCQFISECESSPLKIVTRLVDFLTETSASFIPFQITLFLFVAIINWLPSFSNQSTKRHLLSNSTSLFRDRGKSAWTNHSHVTIWFDKPKSSTATAYVAMSRVASFSCISFLKLSMASHFAQNQQ